jgi:hypothetical protein
MFVFAFDVVLIVHAAKTGRFWPWAYVILFLPGIGGAAYLIVELAPAWLGSYGGQRARQQVVGALNPTRRYNQLRDALVVADTIANRAALAKECLTLRRFEEAGALYEGLLVLPLGDEPQYMLGKARAEVGLARADAAVATLYELKKRWPDYQSSDGHLLLYAIALEGAGRLDDALDNYQGVGRYYPGAEPRVRQAQLLKRLGREADARALAEDVIRLLSRAPKHTRRHQKAWLASAKKIAQS